MSEKNFSTFLRGQEGMTLPPLILLILLGSITSTKLSPDQGGLCTSTLFKCDIRSEARRLTCAGSLHGVYAFHYDANDKIQFLSLCKWYQSYFDPALLRLYPKIEKFTLSRSVITHLVADFPPLPKLKVIVMAKLGLEVLDPTIFSELEHLRVLDLRDNNFLTLSSELLDHLPNLHQVYLAGKDYMCKEDLIWVAEELKPGTLVLDKQEMYCGWKYPGLRVDPVMRILKKMNTQCPSAAPFNCMCMLENAVESLSPLSLEEEDITSRQDFLVAINFENSAVPSVDSLVPIITVDCSYRKLSRLPEYLPDNTTTVLAQGNQISDISDINSNANYSRILDLILDFNPIKSLYNLEGAPWLRNIRNLSLRGNRLSQVPTYILDNALEHNSNINLLYLGDNPWRCDCKFTPSFQDFIIKYERVIPEPLGIRCTQSSDDSISQQPIKTLHKSLICVTEQSNIQGVMLLNITLLTCIMFVILKFCYDYIMYKKFGELPWIVTILP